MLRTLPDESVHTVVTSPPYWGLRDYGLPPSVWGGDQACTHEWDMATRAGQSGGTASEKVRTKGTENFQAFGASEHGTCSKCGAWLGCLGLEPTPQLFVEHLVEVFREVRRVLRADGTVWLNLGDSYATGAGKVGDHPGGGEQGSKWAGRPAPDATSSAGRGRATRDGTHAGKHTGMAALGPMVQPNRMPIPGLKPKDLVMIPARSALALQADGWWVRQDIIWQKPNPMPESVRDRCTKSHEYLFLLSKSEAYYFDADAIAEPAARPEGSGNKERKPASARGVPVDTGGKSAGAVAGSVPWEGATRNKRSVWTVTTQPFKEAHFATFPPALIEPCILASTSARGCCSKCGAPWEREIDKTPAEVKAPASEYGHGAGRNDGGRSMLVGASSTTIGWQPTCGCGAGVVPGTVLDPFGGAGTTGLVSDRLGRDAVLIELNPSYADMAQRRIAGDSPLFAEVAA